MKPFEIYDCQPDGWATAHPCVIVSHPVRADRKNPVDVLMCTSHRATRPPESTEIILDAADGLDWQTLCKCDVIYAMPREELKKRRGQVSLVRRNQLVRKIIAAHGWGEMLAS